ncbi:MAG: hypothetical protein AAFQ65_00330 [Myxococcota bacterium]
MTLEPAGELFFVPPFLSRYSFAVANEGQRFFIGGQEIDFEGGVEGHYIQAFDVSGEAQPTVRSFPLSSGGIDLVAPEYFIYDQRSGVLLIVDNSDVKALDPSTGQIALLAQ